MVQDLLCCEVKIWTHWKWNHNYYWYLNNKKIKTKICYKKIQWLRATSIATQLHTQIIMKMNKTEWINNAYNSNIRIFFDLKCGHFNLQYCCLLIDLNYCRTFFFYWVIKTFVKSNYTLEWFAVLIIKFSGREAILTEPCTFIRLYCVLCLSIFPAWSWVSA